MADEAVLQQRVAALEAENQRLNRINQALIQRVESGPSNLSGAYGNFEHAVFLAEQVRDRTDALNNALADLKQSNRALKVASQEAQAAHRILYDALESIGDAFVLYDKERRLVLANSKFNEFWRASGIQIRSGMHQAEIKALSQQYRLIDRLYEANRPGNDNRALLGDGKVFRLRSGTWLQVSERPTQDGGVVVLYKDITALIENERATREKALAKKSQLLQDTLYNLSQGVVLVNPQQRLETWNQRFAELIELRGELIHPGVKFDALMQQSEVLPLRPEQRDAAGEPLQVIEQALKSGRVLEIRTHPLPEGGFINTYTDITERRRTAEALQQSHLLLEQRVAERTAQLTQVNAALLDAKREAEQANQSKTKFLAAASHDLLQPMNAARLFAASLQDTAADARSRQLVQSLNYSLEDVETLLGALVDISKLDAGRITPDVTHFRADELLANLANEFRTLAANAGLSFHFAPSQAPIQTDSQLLARILRNLLSNAIRYTPSGRVLLGCRRLSDRLSIEVWDSGIGIAADKQQEIFREFNRLNPDDGGRDKGLGLGLAIVDKMAGILGHPVHVRSTLGKGSCFSIEVPYGILAPTRPVPKRASLPAFMQQQLRGRRILVLDNDRAICEAMQTLLSGWGCKVFSARNETEVLALKKEIRGGIDLWIVDYHLDDQATGFEALEALQSLRGRAPVLMVTANYSNELKHRVRECGFSLMHKPVKPAKLKLLIQHLVENRPLSA